MLDIVYYLAVVIALAVATIAGAFFVRNYLSGKGPAQAVSGLFGPKPERRLSVTEQFNLDGRRRLILVRRDGVEHLIMTGGPVDMVIETGIGAPTGSAESTTPDASSPGTVSSRATLRT
ncbi:flagellar biosynthetic protein FliO [Hyphomicrobium sp.]|uniref:flagellar biosynthetic protein FliO n=1 Tax=Hyphomicrobium sp. TaxID=82 RepID=UPI003F724BD6